MVFSSMKFLLNMHGSTEKVAGQKTLQQSYIEFKSICSIAT